tara:strand:+ start:175 stop:627 length:453 start_codon:yes stop_codon:yes gene_type:complete
MPQGKGTYGSQVGRPPSTKKRSKFTMNGWKPFSNWEGEDSARPDGRPKSSAFQSVDKKNKQKLFNKKSSDLQRAWKNIKDPNSNRAKQLKKEAKTIGLTLEQEPPSAFRQTSNPIKNTPGLSHLSPKNPKSKFYSLKDRSRIKIKPRPRK